jgi:hypothetical protein
MTGTLTKALVVLAPVSILLSWAAVSFFRASTVWGLLQLLGAFGRVALVTG